MEHNLKKQIDPKYILLGFSVAAIVGNIGIARVLQAAGLLQFEVPIAALPILLSGLFGFVVGLLFLRYRKNASTIIASQKAAEEARSQLNVLMEFAPEPMVVLKDGKFTYANHRVTDLLGYTVESVPDFETWLQVAYPDPAYRRKVEAIWQQMQRMMARGEPLPLTELLVTGADGQEFPMEFNVTHMNGSLLIMMRDMTHQKRSQELLVQSEKMISVGGLAAGMAHEINNPLGGILSSTYMLRKRLFGAVAKDEEAAKQLGLDRKVVQTFLGDTGIEDYIRRIEESGERAASIVKTVLAFARSDRDSTAPCDLATIANNAWELLGNDMRWEGTTVTQKIGFHLDNADNVPPVTCSETQIQQVLLNIMKNAVQAMTEAGTEKPEIQVSVVRVDQGVEINIRDNGPGMADAVRKRIFEPFYTTKPVGSGTGLGLSISYYIVNDKHNGTIDVLSAEGEGTAFSILLPIPP